MTPAELAARIRHLRTTAGITQVEAARAAGISIPGWARWENGRSQPQAIRLDRIAAALDQPIAALFTNGDTTAIADVIVTNAALDRVRTEGEPAADQLAERLTTQLRARIIAACVVDTNPERPVPRSRRTVKVPRSKPRRRRVASAVDSYHADAPEQPAQSSDLNT